MFLIVPFGNADSPLPPEHASLARFKGGALGVGGEVTVPWIKIPQSPPEGMTSI